MWFSHQNLAVFNGHFGQTNKEFLTDGILTYGMRTYNDL